MWMVRVILLALGAKKWLPPLAGITLFLLSIFVSIVGLATGRNLAGELVLLLCACLTSMWLLVLGWEMAERWLVTGGGDGWWWREEVARGEPCDDGCFECQNGAWTREIPEDDNPPAG